MASLHGETDEQEGRSVEGWMDFLWTLRKEPTEQGCLGKAQESLETQSYAHLQGKQVFKDKRPRCSVILGFLTILKNCQASSKFEAVNSTWLSCCQRHVRANFEMKWRPRAFSRVSTGDSDILSSCDMNDEHA